MHDPLHEEQQSTEQVFDGKLLHVFRDEVRLPDGRTGLREYVRHPGAVVVIPVCEDGTLILGEWGAPGPHGEPSDPVPLVWIDELGRH